jgi:hypothetical protein
MKLPTKTLGLTVALALACGITGAFGQDAKAPPEHDMSSMGQKDMAAHDMMAKNPSMHTMPATVNSVDTKTGIVDVTTGGMSLKVHFPPTSVADLKSGDQITLHMGFSKK